MFKLGRLRTMAVTVHNHEGELASTQKRFAQKTQLARLPNVPPAQTSRRHHYIPRFYLQKWIGGDGKLWKYECEPSGRVTEKLVVPKATGFEWDLYSVPMAVEFWTPWPEDIIERDLLSPIDSAASEVLNAFLAGPPCQITTDNHFEWAVFVNSLIKRDPRNFLEWDTNASSLQHELRESWLARCPTPDSKARMLDVLSGIDIPKMIRNAAREGMAREIRAEPEVRSIQNLQWIVVNSSPDWPFITTDSPLVVNLNNSSAPIRVVSLALDPHHLFIAHSPELVEHSDLEGFCRGILQTHNLALLSKPCRYVYSDRRIEDGAVVRLRFAVYDSLSKYSP